MIFFILKLLQLIFYFIFDCAGSSLLHTGLFVRFFLVVVGRGYSLLAVYKLLIVMASCCRAWALGAWASVVVALCLSINSFSLQVLLE